MKVSAAALGGAMVLKGDVPDVLRPPEIEREPTVLELDIFGTEDLREKLIKENFPSGFSEVEAFQKMGVQDPTTKEGLQVGTPKDNEQAKLLLVRFLELQFKNHGDNVSEVGEKTAQLLTGKTDTAPVTQVSIVDAVEINGIRYDELGNPIMTYTVSPDKINTILRNSSADLVNASWQPGNNEIRFVMYTKNQDLPTMEQSYITLNGSKTPVGEPSYFDHERNVISKEEYDKLLSEAESKPIELLPPKNRYVDYVDGYFGEHTLGNVLALTEIASRNPDKVFFAAGGNPTGMNEIPDIREVRKQLEEKHLWPENLIVVDYEYISDWIRMPAAFGSDIYIDGDFIEKQFDTTASSSYATRIVLEAVRQNVKAGGKDFAGRVGEFLGNNSVDRTLMSNKEEIKYSVLDFQKIKTDQNSSQHPSK